MGLKKLITEPGDSQPVTVTKEHQLQLRLFARIDAYKGTPPDRALFRELLVTAGVTGTAHQVAWLIYGRTDAAGILEVGVKVLAADAGTAASRTVRRALPVLQKACVVRRSRAGKGKPYVYRINAGGHGLAYGSGACEARPGRARNARNRPGPGRRGSVHRVRT